MWTTTRVWSSETCLHRIDLRPGVELRLTRTAFDPPFLAGSVDSNLSISGTLCSDSGKSRLHNFESSSSPFKKSQIRSVPSPDAEQRSDGRCGQIASPATNSVCPRQKLLMLYEFGKCETRIFSSRSQVMTYLPQELRVRSSNMDRWPSRQTPSLDFVVRSNLKTSPPLSEKLL